MVSKEIIISNDLIQYQQGRLLLDELKISTDTRSIQKGNGFVALKGEKFDAYNFIEDVLKKGPALIVYDHSTERVNEVEVWSKDYPQILFLGVENSLKYLQEIAKRHVTKLTESSLKNIIGITGSNGKTTTKNILNHFLESILKNKLICTVGNLNNHIGVPLTLLNISNRHHTAIIEMGTNHPGEIKFLCELVNPNAGIITNIGDAHLEFLISKEGVLKEKRSLFDQVMKNTNRNGLFVINGDDEYLSKLEKNQNVYFLGEKYKNILIKDSQVDIDLDKTYQLINTNLTGNHNFYNLAVSFVLALKLFPDKERELVQAASSFMPANNRSQWMEISGQKIFMDAYNANPSSMEASLRGFFDKCQKENVKNSQICLVLGDMNELGQASDTLHEKIGNLLRELGAENAIFVGRYAKKYQLGFTGTAKIYPDVHKLINDWKNIKKNYEYLFIKGSRSLQLELLMDIT